METKPKSLSASTERLAWSQTTEQGMGTGFDAFKHKRTSKGDILKNYYVGKDTK